MRRQRLVRNLLALILMAPAAWAQANLEVNSRIQFNFFTPGARSLGMGGAFLGLADDATAAYANPAGLTTLTKPEISVEGLHWHYNQVFTDRGRLFGEATGNGVDTQSGLRNGESYNGVTGLSFISFVYPWSRWRFALYRHELASFESRFKTQGAFLTPENATSDERLHPTANSLRLSVANLGLSAALEISPNLSMGAGLSSYGFHLDSLTNRYSVVRGIGQLDQQGEFYGLPLYDPGNIVNFQTQKGGDSALGFNAGFLWRIRDGLALGGVYRSGPNFKFTAATGKGPQAPPTLSEFSLPVRFNTPDFFGLGLSIQPTEYTTISLDYDRVRYSRLRRSLVSIVTGPDQDPAELLRYQIDDANEIHLGFERAFVFRGFQVFARTGAWYDPNHSLRYTGSTPALRALFRRGHSEIHRAAGFGFSGERFAVDGAVDLSKGVDTFSLSTVVRF